MLYLVVFDKETPWVVSREAREAEMSNCRCGLKAGATGGFWKSAFALNKHKSMRTNFVQNYEKSNKSLPLLSLHKLLSAC